MVDQETERERKVIGGVLTALGGGLSEGRRTPGLIADMLDAMGAVIPADPDPADVAAHDRVKVLESKNKKLQGVIERVQWFRLAFGHQHRWPIHGYPNAICTGCGVTNREGQNHFLDCPINNALHPRPACDECTRTESCGVGLSNCPHGKGQPELIRVVISCDNCAKSCPSDYTNIDYCTAIKRKRVANVTGIWCYIEENGETSCHPHPYSRHVFKEGCEDFEPKTEPEQNSG